MAKTSTQGDGKISLLTATSIIVANMVGTGVFTSLGFQIAGIKSPMALLLLWIIGGIFALSGALVYGELAAALPRSGGEYHFLGRIFHPILGFLAGWISFTVGFAAPIALAAMAFGRYFSRVWPQASPLLLSCVIVILVTLVHLRNLRLGSMFQNVFTLFKVLLLLVFIAAAAMVQDPVPLSYTMDASVLDAMLSTPFAVSLLFVMYAYAGWNAATYVTGEVRDPSKNVPRALLLGTALVTVLYVGVNWAFLHTAPMDELVGQIEVGHISATHIFGVTGGRLMSLLLSIALISSISAMVWVGPRVTQAMGQDFPLFRTLASTNQAGIPIRAILLQSAIVLCLLVTSSFEAILVYTQVVLVLSSLLTVLGVFSLRWREPNLPRPYRTWGYPFTPILFAVISIATVAYTATSKPWETLAGLATVLLGIPIYFLSKRGSETHP
jgi:APA family basic amino acid/polyamine antiporter